MSDQKKHINQARHNEQFFSTFDIEKTLFLDWVVNGIFYSALHYLDSYFASKGKHPGDHKARNDMIHQHGSDLGRPFYRLYRPLKDDSEEGRYNMRVFPPEEVRKDILPLLDHIKTHLRRFIPQI